MSAQTLGKKVLGFNFKSYFDKDRAVQWMTGLANALEKSETGGLELLVFPDNFSLDTAVRILGSHSVGIGLQAVSPHPSGAFTGFAVAKMAASWGVSWTMVGHAERRSLAEEDPNTLKQMIMAAREAGLNVLYCLGEAEAGEPSRVARAIWVELENQGLVGEAGKHVVIAYEPIWAIGATLPASPNYLLDVMGELANLSADEGCSLPRTIYGGSANLELVDSLGNVFDGFFLGRAAHDHRVFTSAINLLSGGST